MKITIKEVAKLAGVSIGTASMALNNKKGVNDETRSAVLKVAKSLNYHPNINARSLKTDRTSTIGLVVTDLNNPFFASIVECTRNMVEKQGYKLLLGVSGNDNAAEQKYVNEFVDWNVEGVIIVPTTSLPEDLGHLYYLKSIGIPFVFLSTKYHGISSDCVMTDLYEGSYLLTKHLLMNGHKKIFLITAGRKLLLSSARIEGYANAFREMGLDYKDEWIYETVPDFKHGCDTANEIVEKRPDAIVTVNDILALGVLKFLKDKRIKVPEEISVAGYDDLLFASIAETPLTTVRQPIEEICEKAVELVINRIEGCSKKDETFFFKPELKIRDSTRII